VQTFLWLALAMQGTEALERPETERQRTEVYVLIMSALAQSFVLVVSWVYVMDNSEVVAKHLEAVAPENQTAAVGAPCNGCLHSYYPQPRLSHFCPADEFVAVFSIATLGYQM
jgi:hypothetical protein